jgi:hypothetical protein
VHHDTVHLLLSRQLRLGVFVKLPAGDDVNLKALIGKKETEVTQQLAGRGVIGKEKAINKYGLQRSRSYIRI